MTREHLVSKALFIGDEVEASGFPWCKTEPVKIGLPNLTAKILCNEHNNSLSEVDAAGAGAFDSIRECTRLSNIRSKLKPGFRVVRYHIDGPLLERWFLKTLVNLTFGRQHSIGKDSLEPGQPSKRLVEVAFGIAKFQAQVGLSSVVHAGEQIASQDTVRFAPLIKDGSYIAGGLFAFRGFRYFLSLDPPGMTQLPNGVGFPGEDWSGSQLNFHNRQMRELDAKQHLSQVIETHW